MHTDPIPYGYCHCGCGQKTRIAKANDPRCGHVKGEPVRFLKAHHHRGKAVSQETRAKLSAAKLGTGISTNYFAVHQHLRKLFPKKGICEACGGVGPTEYALIHGWEYTRDRGNYREMCHGCNMKYDLGGKPQKPRPPATHCRKGHLMDEANTGSWPSGSHRRCLRCRRERLDRRAEQERNARRAAAK